MGQLDRAAAGARVFDVLGQHPLHLAAQFRQLAEGAPVAVLGGPVAVAQQVAHDALGGVAGALAHGSLGLGHGLLHVRVAQESVPSVPG